MKIKSVIYLPTVILSMIAAPLLTSCIDETQPTDVLSDNQVSGMASAQDGMLNGITAYMVTYNSWGVDETTNYYLNDWGYPCQMFFREVCGSDIPVYDASYSYWYSIESAEQTRYTPYYTYKYYYKLISNCNNLIGVIDPTSASTTSLQKLGCALTFRALAYMDIARMFEFKKTGVASLDTYADSYGIWGLTVPIVTEKTTLDDCKQNPRVPFTTMYRFILTDLNRAESYLTGYERKSKTLPDLSVVYGMKARFWLEMGSRFEQNADDLTKMQEADSKADEDGYDQLGVTSAVDCYRKAQQYAQLAMNGYEPMTRDEWHSPQTGFNTPNKAWMWCMSVSQREQIPDQYYNSFIGTMSSEPSWAMPRGYNAFRCIGSYLYAKMGDGDWRKRSWVAPEDAGRPAAKSNYQTSLDETEFTELPAYANLKFRPASGDLEDYYVGLLGDLPLMRVEEMALINIEITARLNGVAAGWAALKSFVNTYRYTDGSYAPRESSLMSDFVTELMVQKRIELWGEGLCFFDYKRLNLQVRRTDNTNYKDAFLLNSIEGYTAPWMNYFILEYEQELNTALVPNPDTSGSIKAQSNTNNE
ncbi:MAG: RagB/SusD family nutrient uptake outer membrane protein [Prevotella sp.]